MPGGQTGSNCFALWGAWSRRRRGAGTGAEDQAGEARAVSGQPDSKEEGPFRSRARNAEKNALETNATLRFAADLNHTTARESTSYTSLVATGSRSGYVVYSRLLPSPSISFALRFKLD